MRDSSIAIPGGAIVSRTLAALGMPIFRTITGIGMIEGGSFAWLKPGLAAIGRGIRVNDEAISQVREVLARQGAEVIVADLPAYSIHLDGWLLMIDRDLALLDPRGLSFTFLEQLKAHGIEWIEMRQEDNAWCVNGLAVRPGRVLMPEGLSSETRAKLEKREVEIVTVPYDKVQLNGGGIHCSTCPLVRDRI